MQRKASDSCGFSVKVKGLQPGDQLCSTSLLRSATSPSNSDKQSSARIPDDSLETFFLLKLTLGKGDKHLQ